MIDAVADQIATRYGILPRDITHAALQTIVLTTADAVDALDDTQQWLRRMGIPDAHTVHPSPRQRWEQLLRNLFPTSILVVDLHASASPDLVTVPLGDNAEERSVGRLLRAAATFLTVESAELEEFVDLSQHWTSAEHANTDPAADTVDAILRRVTRAARTLLDHADSGRWRELLAVHGHAAAAGASRVPAPQSRDAKTGPVVSRRLLPGGWVNQTLERWSAVGPKERSDATGAAWSIHATATTDTADRVLDTVWDYCVEQAIGFDYRRSAVSRVSLETDHMWHDGDSIVRIAVDDEDSCGSILRDLAERLEQLRNTIAAAGSELGGGSSLGRASLYVLHRVDVVSSELVDMPPANKARTNDCRIPGEMVAASAKQQGRVSNIFVNYQGVDSAHTQWVRLCRTVLDASVSTYAWTRASRSKSAGVPGRFRATWPYIAKGRLVHPACGGDLTTRAAGLTIASFNPGARGVPELVHLDTAGWVTESHPWRLPPNRVGTAELIGPTSSSSGPASALPSLLSGLSLSGVVNVRGGSTSPPGATGRERLRRLCTVLDAPGEEIGDVFKSLVAAAGERCGAQYCALRVFGADERDVVAEFVFLDVDSSDRLLAIESRRVGQRGGGDRDELDMPVLVNGKLFGSLLVAEKQGEDRGFTEDDHVVLTAFASAAGIAAYNARLRKQSVLRSRAMATLAEINAHLFGGGAREDALALITDRTREMARADSVLLVLAEGAAGAEAVIRAASGNGCTALVGTSLALDEETTTRLFTLRYPEFIPDGTALAPTGWPVAGQRPGPVMVMPLRTENAVLGVLLVVRSVGAAPFNHEHAPLAASFGDQAALALQLADKQTQQRQLDVLADRDRIAGNLHDHVIQRLFATGIDLQGSIRRIVDSAVRERVSRAVEQIDETVREIRTSIFDLHTAGTSSATSLRRSMLDIVSELAVDTTLTPAVRIAGTVDTLVPSDLAAHATAVLYEAVSNAVRHARARSLVITVEAGADLVIDVVDDGVGMPQGAARSGLLGVERRATKCGGSVGVLPGPAGGTRLTWRAPLHQVDQADNVIRLFDREDAAGERLYEDHVLRDGGSTSHSRHQVIEWTVDGDPWQAIAQ